jgi:hypothetical protein
MPALRGALPHDGAQIAGADAEAPHKGAAEMRLAVEAVGKMAPMACRCLRWSTSAAKHSSGRRARMAACTPPSASNNR